jgi:hypothetical protein
MDHSKGANETGGARLSFDRRVRQEFHGSKNSSDGGLLLVRELDEVLGLHDIAGGFLRDIRIHKRQAEGFAFAKASGVYKGGKTRIDGERVHQLSAEGRSTYKIAEAMSVSRKPVHRILNTESA